MSTATINAESSHRKQRITMIWLVISQVLAFILLVLPALVIVVYAIMNLESVPRFLSSLDAVGLLLMGAIAIISILGPIIAIPSAVSAWRSFAKEQYRRAAIVTSIPMLFVVLSQCVLPMFFPLLITFGDSFFYPPDNSPNPIAIDLQERARTSDIRDEFTPIEAGVLAGNADSVIDEKFVLNGDLLVIRDEDTFLMRHMGGMIIVHTTYLSHELPDTLSEYSGPMSEAPISLTVYGVGRGYETIRNVIQEKVTMPSVEAIIIEEGS